MKRFLIPGIMLCLLFCPPAAMAQDWGTCHEALKELRVASRRASFETLETHRKEKQLSDCLAVKYYQGRCPPIEKDLRLQRERARSALAHTQAAIFQVELSCRQCMPSAGEDSSRDKHAKLWRDMCAKLKEATANMSPEERMALCKKLRFPGDCSKCLGPPPDGASAKPGE